MTRIESKHVIIPKPASEVYNYLITLKNVENILPGEKITNFIASDKSFSFKITGAIPVELEVTETRQYDWIRLKTTPNNSFQFTLDINLKDAPEGCEAYQICEADVNPFMKMMIEKPLSNLFDYMVDRLQTVLSQPS